MEGKISPEDMKKLEKYVERLANSISFITKAEEDGYFLEAVVRIDALLELALDRMVAFSCDNAEQAKELKLIKEVIGAGKFIKYAPCILVKKNLISVSFINWIIAVGAAIFL